MAASPYHLKPQAIWAERIPETLTDIVEVAERWGAEVRVHPEDGISVSLRFAVGGNPTGKPGDWLMDRPGQGKGCCTNDEFVASFDPVDG